MNDRPIPIRPHRLRRCLWKAAGILILLFLTAIIGNFLVPADRAVTRPMLGHDFLPFYAAGSMARHRQFANLYDLSAIKASESATAHAAGLTVGFGPWWNPPFAAWLFAPFSLLPFPAALIAWQATGAGALILSIILLARMLPAPHWLTWALIPLLIFTSNPLLAVFAHAQNTFITLLLLTLTVTCWRSRHPLAAGLIAGLLLYKPQHALLISLALVFSLGWRAAAGLALTAAALLLITIFTMPGALADYLRKLPRMLAVMQELSPYAWDRHVTLKAFWRLLLQGAAPGPTHWVTCLLWWTSELLIAAVLCRIAWHARRDPIYTDRFIAATIVAGPLLVPFCFDYDLLILAIPAVLCAADAIDHGPNRRLLWAWIAVYLILHISTPLAQLMSFILATPALAALLVVHLPRRQPRPARIEAHPAPPAILAA